MDSHQLIPLKHDFSISTMLTLKYRLSHVTEIPPKAQLDESQPAASYWYLVPLVSRSGIAPFRCSMLETQEDT